MGANKRREDYKLKKMTKKAVKRVHKDPRERIMTTEETLAHAVDNGWDWKEESYADFALTPEWVIYGDYMVSDPQLVHPDCYPVVRFYFDWEIGEMEDKSGMTFMRLFQKGDRLHSIFSHNLTDDITVGLTEERMKGKDLFYLVAKKMAIEITKHPEGLKKFRDCTLRRIGMYNYKRDRYNNMEFGALWKDGKPQ